MARHVLVPLLIVAAVTAFVAVTIGLGPQNDYFGAYDFREIFTYQKAFHRDAVLDGRLPLWNPHTFGGWPFAANPLVQAWYPPTLVFVFLPQWLAAITDLLLHLAFAALGLYALLRTSFGTGRGAAAFGAIVYGTSGSFVGHAFAGHIQFYAAAAYTPWLLLALDGIARNLREEERDLGRAGLWFAGGAGLLGLQILSGGLPFVWLSMLFASIFRLGAALVRPSELPAELAALFALSVAGCAIGAIQMLPSYELAQLCNRTIAGYDYAVAGSYEPSLLKTLLMARAEVPEQIHLWEFYGYAGVLPVAAALLALAGIRRDPRIAVLAGTGVLSVLFMFGENGFLFPILWNYVPGFDLFRAPARALAILNFVVALLAALGWQELSRRIPGRSAAVATAVLCLIALVDVASAARANRDGLFLEDDALLEQPFHREENELLASDDSWHRFWFRRALYRQNEAYRVGARSIGGYDNMFLRRYSRFIHHMTDTEITPSLVTILTQKTFTNTPSPFPFKILGVKYAHREGRIEVQRAPVRRSWFVTSARRVADEDAALAHMRSPAFDPLGEVLFETPEADRLGLPAVDQTESAGVEPTGPSDVEVTVTEITPEHLRIELGGHPAGFLVLSEIHYPGWTAEIDGRSVDVLRADSILRGVKLEANDHTVEMHFRPGAQRLGSWITGLALLALAGLCYWSLRRARPPERPRT